MTYSSQACPISGQVRSAQLTGCSGFTLLELIVVCALLGLLMMSGLPALLNSVGRDEIRVAGSDLIVLIRSVKEEAQQNRSENTIYFDLDKNVVYLRGGAESEEEQDRGKTINFPGNVQLRSVWLQSQGVLSHGIAELWISHEGFSEQCIVHLLQGQDEISLVINSFLPRIDVEDGRVDPD